MLQALAVAAALALLYWIYKPRQRPPSPTLPPAEALRLYSQGLLPVFAYPHIDEEQGNGIKRCYLAEYERGVEITIVFWDEDRPSPLLALCYDLLRYPMFGRWEDVETIFIFMDGDGFPTDVHFPGTYSGGATWFAKVPQHITQTVSYRSFELLGVHRALPAGGLPVAPSIRRASLPVAPSVRRASTEPAPSSCRSSGGDGAGGPRPPPIVVWCNTWNHAFAERNTNEDMRLVHRHPMPSLESQHLGEDCTRYPLCVGSRAEVDARFGGLVKSFVSTKPSEVVARLGTRRL